MITTPRLSAFKQTTEQLLRGCIIEAADGTRMYTPDGKGNYAALWTRDFAYMVEDAGELIPLDDIRRGIEYLIRGARPSDGWIPDRVNRAGMPAYTAGSASFPASPNLDNACFLCLLADNYLSRLEPQAASTQFLAWREVLCRGLAALPTAPNGLICNTAIPPHSPYGFTDTVCKTGYLCMESLLLWRAKRTMIDRLSACGCSSADYERDCVAIEHSFAEVFLQSDGTLRAATDCCAQTDVWAMCYAISIGFPLSDRCKRDMVRWLISCYDSVVFAGQLRHLPAGEHWEKTFIPIAPETYQNGAFWATPIKWLCDALRLCDATLATQTAEDALDYFETHGIFECVNGDDRKLDTYVASATALYGVLKQELKIKGEKIC